MALPDISKLNVAELEELIKNCTAQIDARKKTKKKELAKKFRELARDEGLEIAEIIDDGAPTTRKRRGKKASAKKIGRKKRGKVAPKYRNPANSRETWTGRGRKPAWVVAALDAGKKLQDLAIK